VEPKEWVRIDSKFRRLYQYFPTGLRPTTIPFTEVECNKAKAIF